MTTATDHAHVVRDARILGGEPIIKGTRTPVRAVVETWRLGVPAEEIPTHMPHLSVADVFHALSFFGDHAEEIERHIAANAQTGGPAHPPAAAP